MVAAGSAIIPATFRRIARRITCVAIIVLAACGPLQTKPNEAPALTVSTKTVSVPDVVLVPCIDPATRPRLPPPTQVAPDATPEQRNAAVILDARNLRAFTDAVDEIFLACTKGATP